MDRRNRARAACTIIARNYLAHARVLARTYLQHHPEGRFYLLVVDGLPDGVAPGEGIQLVNVEELGLKYLWEMCFKYDVTELSTAVKPSLLRLLIDSYGEQTVTYIDPDIAVLRAMNELFVALRQWDIVLTPHALQSIPLDGKVPSEQDLLVAGAYNLGFLALRKSDTVDALLPWWEERLRDHCRVEPAKGLMVDQKWVDLVPGMFQSTLILRDPTYNVAYWNLHERRVGAASDLFTVNGKPLTFYHFSGYSPQRPNVLSKHQNRTDLEAGSPLRTLFDRYRQWLLESGYEEARQWPYRFASFDNGVATHPVLCQLYLELEDGFRLHMGDPFETKGAQSFFRWAVQPALDSRGLSPFLERIYKLRYDVASAFPDVAGGDRDGFMAWVRTSGVNEMGIDPRLIDPVELHTVDGRTGGLSAGSGNGALPGVNVCGYLRAENGLGSAARGYVSALRQLRVGIALKDVSSQSAIRSEDLSLAPFDVEFPHPVNLVCVNADQHFVIRNSDPEFFADRYNIGVWFWELPEFPDQWSDRFAEYQELWVGTSFLVNAISKVSPIPVVRVPPVVLPMVDGSRARGRESLGVTDDEMVLLFIFDFHSFAARKNPLGAVQAFRGAFSARDPVRLVIKCVNADAHPDDFNLLKSAVEGLPVTLLSGYAPRQSIADLFEACDAYVSLHRSEGTGLTIAEAMACGKPVIATAWSGNMDFMDVSNSFPVRYELATIQKDIGPYRTGQVWAEPSVEHATDAMRFIFENPREAKLRGEKARYDIANQFSVAPVADLIKLRLTVIQKQIADTRRRSQAEVRPAYRDTVAWVKSIVRNLTEPGSVCCVISKGDEALVDLPDREGWHFPRDDDGAYAGYYPGESASAIAHLELLRERGAGYLVVPSTSRWWLDYYQSFGEHLQEYYVLLADDDSGVVFRLVSNEVGLEGVPESTAVGAGSTVPIPTEAPPSDGAPSSPPPESSTDQQAPHTPNGFEELRHVTLGRIDRQAAKLHEVQVAIEDAVGALTRRLEEVAGRISALGSPVTADDLASVLRQRDREFDVQVGSEAPGFVLDATTDGCEDSATLADQIFGSWLQVAERARTYVPFLRRHGHVTCLGVGRGECLEVFSDAGLRVLGLVGSKKRADELRGRGFEIVERAPLDYLHDLPSGCLDSVFAIGLVEYMEVDKLRKLLHVAAARMRPRRRLVIESVNPENYEVFRTFHRDLDRMRPVFPAALVELCRGAGFASARVVYPDEGQFVGGGSRPPGVYSIVALTG